MTAKEQADERTAIECQGFGAADEPIYPRHLELSGYRFYARTLEGGRFGALAGKGHR